MPRRGRAGRDERKMAYENPPKSGDKQSLYVKNEDIKPPFMQTGAYNAAPRDGAQKERSVLRGRGGYGSKCVRTNISMLRAAKAARKGSLLSAMMRSFGSVPLGRSMTLPPSPSMASTAAV